MGNYIGNEKRNCTANNKVKSNDNNNGDYKGNGSFITSVIIKAIAW